MRKPFGWARWTASGSRGSALRRQRPGVFKSPGRRRGQVGMHSSSNDRSIRGTCSASCCAFTASTGWTGMCWSSMLEAHQARTYTSRTLRSVFCPACLRIGLFAGRHPIARWADRGTRRSLNLPRARLLEHDDRSLGYCCDVRAADHRALGVALGESALQSAGLLVDSDYFPAIAGPRPSRSTGSGSRSA